MATTCSTPAIAFLHGCEKRSNGESLGVVHGLHLGDGNSDAGKAEDRFFGAVHAAGISSCEIRMAHSGYWEVDHFQYGRQ